MPVFVLTPAVSKQTLAHLTGEWSNESLFTRKLAVIALAMTVCYLTLFYRKLCFIAKDALQGSGLSRDPGSRRDIVPMMEFGWLIDSLNMKRTICTGGDGNSQKLTPFLNVSAPCLGSASSFHGNLKSG